MSRFLTVTLAVVLLVLAVCPIGHAMAEETPTEGSLEEKTEILSPSENPEEGNVSRYFVEVWLDKLLNGLAVVVGCLGAVLACLSKVKKAHGYLVGETKKLGENEKVLGEMQKVLATQQAECAALIGELRQALHKVAGVEESTEALRVEVQQDMGKLLGALRLALTNDSGLVTKGVAKEIAKLLEVKNEEE